MKRFYFIGMVLFACVCMSVDTPKKQKYKAYLGCELSDSLQINVNDFKQLIAKNLCAKDSANTIFVVESFDIVYAERGLYQDEEGLPIIYTDYSTIECKGDSIPVKWKNIFNERAHKSDTVYFDRIKIRTKENTPFMCKCIKVILK